MPFTTQVLCHQYGNISCQPPCLNLSLCIHPEDIVAAGKVIVNVMADGRCFWSCLYLSFCTDATRASWHEVGRNATGFPSTVKRISLEQQDVYRFVAALLHGQIHHADQEMHGKVLSCGIILGNMFIFCMCKSYIYMSSQACSSANLQTKPSDQRIRIYKYPVFWFVAFWKLSSIQDKREMEPTFPEVPRF